MKGHPLFAALYDPLTWWGERRLFGQMRSHLLTGLTGRVLEIGVGTGASLPYYPASVEVVGTDPDRFMLRRAVRRAGRVGPSVALVRCAAEALPFRDSSFDAAVSALTLCTVHDPDGALAEVRRVVRPGGTLRLLEHVRAEGWRGRAQDAIAPAWRPLAAGCHPNRRTGDALRRAGFGVVDLALHDLGVTLLLVGTARVGAGAGHGGPGRTGDSLAPR